MLDLCEVLNAGMVAGAVLLYGARRLIQDRNILEAIDNPKTLYVVITQRAVS